MIPSIAGRAHQNGMIIFFCFDSHHREGRRDDTSVCRPHIPIHPTLVALGFLNMWHQYIRVGPSFRTFYTWSYSIKVPTWSSGLLNQLHIPSPGPVLDSFRPTLAGQLILAGVS
jgi:hypothetical protein